MPRFVTQTRKFTCGFPGHRNASRFARTFDHVVTEKCDRTVRRRVAPGTHRRRRTRRGSIGQCIHSPERNHHDKTIAATTAQRGLGHSAAVLALSARAYLQERTVSARAEDPQVTQGLLPLATGQFITPTFIKGAVQQYLNPGLADYPNFVAGEAVRSQLSPDGTTLAIITAGQNSLDKPDGTLDMANSTQFIFLYNVEGANKAKPALMQVIQQVNAHVGLVFSPDGNTLYAAGGADDAVYVYAKSGGASSEGTADSRSVGTVDADCHSVTPQQRRRPRRQAQRQRHGHLRRRHDAGRRQQLQRLDQRHRHRDALRSLRARSAPVLRQQRGHGRRRRRHLSVRRRRERQWHGLRVVRPRPRSRGGRRLLHRPRAI